MLQLVAVQPTPGNMRDELHVVISAKKCPAIMYVNTNFHT